MTRGDALAEALRRPRTRWSLLAIALGTFGLLAGIMATNDASTNQTVVSLTFDDSLASQLAAVDVLDRYGLLGTFYVNEGRIDVSSTAMTSADLEVLAATGHEIGGHTLNHARLSALDYDEARRTICLDRNNLIERGFEVTSFAYPFGATSPEATAAVRDCGYNSARDVGGVSPREATSETMPPQERFETASVRSFRETTTVADMQQYVLDAQAAGGGWVQVIFHDICEACSPQGVTIEDFEAFVSWLAARQGPDLAIKRVKDVITGEVAPTATAPPAPPERDGNLLLNPGLESEHPYLEDHPECWARGASRDTMTSFSRTADARSGSFAEEITMTFSPGAGYTARIESRRDQGGCAPTVPGRGAYEVSAWYKSDTTVRLVVAYRDSTGSWWTHEASEEYGPASDWAEVVFVTAPVPPEAVAISLRFEVRAEGTAVVDDLVARAVVS